MNSYKKLMFAAAACAALGMPASAVTCPASFACPTTNMASEAVTGVLQGKNWDFGTSPFTIAAGQNIYLAVSVASNSSYTLYGTVQVVGSSGTLNSCSAVVPALNGCPDPNAKATMTTVDSVSGVQCAIQETTPPPPPPSTLSLSASPTSITWNGGHTVITITANEGTYVSPVTVNLVTGPAKIASSAQIVIPNGSLSGSTQVTLTSTKATGTATVNASANGFTGASTQVTVKH